MPDGSAVEYTPQEAGTITGVLWRTKNQTPDIEFDYRKMKIKLDARGTAKLSGTLTFGDLEKLPRHSYVTLLQCGAPTPHGIVKWTGVRFSDFAQAMGAQSFAYYGRLVGLGRLLHRRGHEDADAPAGDPGVAAQRRADPAAARRAAAPDRPVPLRRPQPQGDHGNFVHRDVICAAEAVADVTPGKALPVQSRRSTHPVAALDHSRMRLRIPKLVGCRPIKA